MVLVIYRLPDNTLMCKNTVSLNIPPIGHSHIFGGKSYVVESTTTPLDSHGGFGQVLDVLRQEYDDAVSAAAAIAGMVNLDAPKLDVRAPITLATEPDDVLLVVLKKAGSKATSKPKAVTMFNLDVKSLLTGGSIQFDGRGPFFNVKALADRAQQGLDTGLKGRKKRTRTGPKTGK